MCRLMGHCWRSKHRKPVSASILVFKQIPVASSTLVVQKYWVRSRVIKVMLRLVVAAAYRLQ